jgi:hypothetical protein
VGSAIAAALPAAPDASPPIQTAPSQPAPTQMAPIMPKIAAIEPKINYKTFTPMKFFDEMQKFLQQYPAVNEETNILLTARYLPDLDYRVYSKIPSSSPIRSKEDEFRKWLEGRYCLTKPEEKMNLRIKLYNTKRYEKETLQAHFRRVEELVLRLEDMGENVYANINEFKQLYLSLANSPEVELAFVNRTFSNEESFKQYLLQVIKAATKHDRVELKEEGHIPASHYSNTKGGRQGPSTQQQSQNSNKGGNNNRGFQQGPHQQQGGGGANTPTRRAEYPQRPCTAF